MPGGVAPKFGSEKVSRYTGVSQLQLRVSRYTVQLSTKWRNSATPEKVTFLPPKNVPNSTFSVINLLSFSLVSLDFHLEGGSSALAIGFRRDQF